MRNLFFVIACLACLLPAPSWAAADPDLTAGRALFQHGDYQAARERLFAAFLRQPDDPEINFLLGRVAFEQGDYESAVMAYDRLLIVEPSSLRGRLELARCHLALGNQEAASQLLLEVLNSNPPATVRDNINVLLAAIQEQNRRHALHGSLALGYSYDDNARVAPSNDIIRIYLDRLAIDATAERPKSDNILAATLGLDHTYQTERQGLLWRSAMLGYQSGHQFEDDQNIGYLSLQSGPVWQRQDYGLEFHPLFTTLSLGHKSYLDAVGAELVASWFPRPNLIQQLALRLEDKRYAQDHARDALAQTYTLSSYLQLGQARFTANLSTSIENAENAINSFTAYGLGLRLDYDLTTTVTGFGSVAYSTTTYEAENPLFLTRRDDEETILTAGARKLLWQDRRRGRQLLAEASCTLTRANSNIALYTYDKNVVSLLLAFTF